MKYIVFSVLLLFCESLLADIDSVKVYPNSLLISGNGLNNIKRATLARKPLIVTTLTDHQLAVFCKCERFPTGVQKLRVFKRFGGKFTADVTITGQEVSPQPPIPPSERPQPAG